MADRTELEKENLRLQAALLELDNENRRLVAAIKEHFEKMNALGSAGGDQDRKLWRAIELTTQLAARTDGDASDG